jgi:hypothetical protein
MPLCEETLVERTNDFVTTDTDTNEGEKKDQTREPTREKDKKYVSSIDQRHCPSDQRHCPSDQRHRPSDQRHRPSDHFLIKTRQLTTKKNGCCLNNETPFF